MTIQRKQFKVCPKCKNELLYYDVLRNCEDYVWRKVTCIKCDYKWQEVYQFVLNETISLCEELDDEGNIAE